MANQEAKRTNTFLIVIKTHTITKNDLLLTNKMYRNNIGKKTDVSCIISYAKLSKISVHGNKKAYKNRNYIKHIILYRSYIQLSICEKMTFPYTSRMECIKRLLTTCSAHQDSRTKAKPNRKQLNITQHHSNLTNSIGQILHNF